MNKLLNDALRAKGYAGPDIKMVLTDVTDQNGPYYTDTLTNTVVFDRKKLANSNRNEILNALGHEFGHYSKEDNKTGKQTIANYSGDKLEARTKAMVSKEATEDTLASIRNNPNVITGEEGRLLADSIPMERREYDTYSESGSIGGALFGAGGIGYTTYKCFDYKNNKIQVVKVIEGEVGQGAPFDIGVSLSLGWYPGINSFDEFGDYTIAKGGSIDPVWVATRGQKIGIQTVKNNWLYRVHFYFSKNRETYKCWGYEIPMEEAEKVVKKIKKFLKEHNNIELK